MITLRQIQFALAVAQHLHFKRAAEACFVSQSALSLGIAEFEKILGVTIFERSNKQVIVTPIGKSLLARAEALYLDAQQLMEVAQASQQPLTSEMSIGFIPTIAPYFLPKILPEIRQQHPHFPLNVHEDVSERLIESVHSGQLDAAVIALPYPVDGLMVDEFGAERFFLIAHEQEPLSKLKAIKPSQLLDAPLMLLSDGHCLKDQIIDICNFSGAIDKGALKEASLATLTQMAVNNMGVTLIPEMALDAIADYQQVRTVPLSVPGSHRRLALIYRHNYARTEELAVLRQIFSAVVATPTSSG